MFLEHVAVLTLSLERWNAGFVPLPEAHWVEGMAAHGKDFDLFTFFEVLKADATSAIMKGLRFFFSIFAFFNVGLTSFVVDGFEDFIGNSKLFEWWILRAKALGFSQLVLLPGG